MIFKLVEVVGPNFVVPNFAVPNFVVPNFDVPNFVVPNFVVPNFQISQNDNIVAASGPISLQHLLSRFCPEQSPDSNARLAHVPRLQSPFERMKIGFSEVEDILGRALVIASGERSVIRFV